MSGKENYMLWQSRTTKPSDTERRRGRCNVLTGRVTQRRRVISFFADIVRLVQQNRGLVIVFSFSKWDCALTLWKIEFNSTEDQESRIWSPTFSTKPSTFHRTTVNYLKSQTSFLCCDVESASITVDSFQFSKMSSRFSSKQVSSKFFWQQKHSPSVSTCPPKLWSSRCTKIWRTRVQKYIFRRIHPDVCSCGSLWSSWSRDCY